MVPFGWENVRPRFESRSMKNMNQYDELSHTKRTNQIFTKNLEYLRNDRIFSIVLLLP